MNLKTPRVEDFAAYMIERHGIYLKRKAGEPGPWTHDLILGQYRFCNIFRELDTVTQWIHNNIRVPYADHPNLWFMLCIARYINRPETLAEMIDTGAFPNNEHFTLSRMTQALEYRASRKEPVYTGAYMIRAESDPKKEWYSWSKHRYIAEIVLGRVWEKRRRFEELLERGAKGDPSVTLERVWSLFQAPEFVGWGPFMAYEVITDLRHTRYLRNAQDISTWANAGPGAIRGLNRLYGRDLKAQPCKELTNLEMFLLQQDLNHFEFWAPSYNYWGDLKEDFIRVFGPSIQPREGECACARFEMRDVEHTLCEFDKYERVRLGEGKPRSKYNWREATDIR